MVDVSGDMHAGGREIAWNFNLDTRVAARDT